jgi:RHS repeat-associated protein
MQGAGGVGGLLIVNQPSTQVAFVAYDGNGNVSTLVNAANSSVLAQYEYGPFGELIRATGPMAKLNPFRFSTKYEDDETDLVYYGYRYYNASTERWLNRDPAEESGGINLYAFVENNPLSEVDVNGLASGPVGSWLTSTIVDAIKRSRLQGMFRSESSAKFGASGTAEVGFKYGVIARTSSDTCTDVSAYANLYGQLKFPVGFLPGFWWVVEPSGGMAGSIQCCLCSKKAADFHIGPYSCTGNITGNFGIMAGLRSPGFDNNYIKIYAEGGLYVGWTYNFQTKDSVTQIYGYFVDVLEWKVGKWKETRRDEYRWGTTVDF